MKLKDKPAFPAKMQAKDPMTAYMHDIFTQGMTLREYYTGLAMQGICQASDEAAVWIALRNELDTKKGISKAAVKMADALLAELERSGGEKD